MKLKSVTSVLVLINVIAFIICQLVGGETIVREFGLYPIGSELFSPIQLISHMFLHGGFTHLLFNMIALLSFGSYIEKSIGSVKFLILYLSFGLFAAFFNMALVDSLVIGASGAIFGLFMMFAFMFPEEKVYLFFIPIGFKVKYIASLVFLLEIFYGVSGHVDNIAHFAHIGGGLAGIGFYFLSKKS